MKMPDISQNYPSLNRIHLLNVPIDAIAINQLLDIVKARGLERQQSVKIMYVNIHCMNSAYRDQRQRQILNNADIVYCDGFGVVLGAKLAGKYLPERMTGADFLYDLCELCQDNGLSIFFLGGKEGVGKKAGEKLRTLYPDLKIAGIQNGYFSKDENKEIIEQINNSKTDILLIGFGTPLQEYWVDDHFDSLEVPVVWCIGAVLDFVSQKVSRAPHWMLNNGLEWLYRLIIEPGRMWHRYVYGNPLFYLRIFKHYFICKKK